jgi:hypothetical protein
MESGDMDFSDFANFLFLRNTDGKSLEINLHGIQSSKELFCFCLDILCKGLILLFGNDNKVSLKDLTIENFETVCNRMKCIGIECHLNLTEVETPVEKLIDIWTQNFLNMQAVNDMEENMALEDYKFELQTAVCIYRITFSVIHNASTRCHF